MEPKDLTGKLSHLSSLTEAPPRAPLSQVVEALCRANGGMIRNAKRVPCAEPLPSREQVHRVVEGLRSVLFPGYFGDSEVTPESLRYSMGNTLDWVRRVLREQIKRGICFSCQDQAWCGDCGPQTDQISEAFMASLPGIQAQVASDVQAAYEGDPAAITPDEAIFCYPGVIAVTNYRLANKLHLLGVPLLPRMITEYAHAATGIDIHPGATIGESFFIDHGTGVVVGETCIIGKRVQIYQGVTLGAKSFPLDEDGNPIKGMPRHPIIEDDVTIYAGATILGRVTIGAGSVVGGNVWLTRGVPPRSMISNKQPRAGVFIDGGGI